MSENILVIKLGSLGGFFLALGSMQAIKKHHENAKITLLTREALVDIAERSALFDNIITTDITSLIDIIEITRLMRFFNKEKFTRIYDLQNNDITPFFYKLCFKKPEWAGFIKKSKISSKTTNWKSLHMFKRHKEILKAAGIENVSMPDISWMKSDVEHLLKIENVKRPFVIFMPGGSPQHPEKRWPAVRFGGLALKLIRDGYDIVLLGEKEDKDAIDKIKASCPKVKDLSDKTSLYDVYSLAEESSGIISNDVDPSYIAALTHKPMVALFCSKVSNAELAAPIGKYIKGIEADNMANIPVKDVYELFEPLEIESYIPSITKHPTEPISPAIDER